MTQVALMNSKKSARGFGPGTLRRVLGLVRQRNALAKLDDRALKDIGITRLDAQTEASRPFWDAPDAWLK